LAVWLNHESQRADQDNYTPLSHHREHVKDATPNFQTLASPCPSKHAAM
jgi:hypothetical protein